MKSIINQSESTNPSHGIYNPTDAMRHSWGERIMPEVPPVPAGMTRISITAIEGDGVNGQWVVVDRLAADLAAEENAAKFATLDLQSASLFRSTMRINFGDMAETNRAIGEKEVESYFIGLRMAGTITAIQLADASLLTRLFSELAAWNGTGETWSIYEQWGSQIP